ncbi:T9SS type A sorting domain-containing protein [bacterium]|nr:T9SS type A sorting domain-containing protein [bacterium]
MEHAIPSLLRRAGTRWTLLALLWLASMPRIQATLVEAEYFIDVDPGIGFANALPISPGLSINANFNLPLTGLVPGYHFLAVRVKDDQYGWSVAYDRLFYISPLQYTTQPVPPPLALQRAEYFFNSDPGAGNGTPIAFTSGTGLNVLRTIPTTGLSTGVHRIGVRVEDLSGQWSQTFWTQIRVSDPAGQTELPVANFTVPSGINAGVPATFVNTSTNFKTGRRWAWDIGADGSIEFAGKDLTYTFPSPGEYDVLLRVSNPGTPANASGLLGLYRFYNGELVKQAGTLGDMVKTGSIQEVLGRHGDPKGAYSTEGLPAGVHRVGTPGDSIALGDFSLSYWFKGSSSNYGVNIETNNADVRSTETNELHYVGTRNVASDNQSGNTLQNGQWHHVVLTWQSGAVNGFKSYLDGVLIQQTNATGNNLGSFAQLWVGSNATTKSNGVFDDVYLFGSVLDTSEIGLLYDEAISSTVVKRVVVGPSPTNQISLSGPATFCSGDSVVLTAPAGSNPVWSNGANTASIVVSESGVFSCSYLDINGFPRITPSIEITVEPSLNIAAVISPAVNGLANGSIQLSVSGGSGSGYTYLWSDGSTLPGRSGLAPGMYSVTVGNTFCPVMRTFLVPNQILNPVEGLIEAEYFVDADPGPGMGTPFSFGPGTTLNGSAIVDPTAGLSPGFHKLGIRFREDPSIWGVAQFHLFYMADTAAPPAPEPLRDVVEAEYFFDADPGVGLGTPVPGIVPNSNLSQAFSASTAGLSTGFHIFNLRTRDSNGKWSISQTANVFVDILPPPNLLSFDFPIIQAEYFFDTDPGVGMGTSIPLTQGNVLSLPRTIPVTGLTPGNHRLVIRVRDSWLNWSTVRSELIAVTTQACTPPAVNFSAPTVNAGSPTTLTSTSTGVAPGATFQWDIGADGSVEYTGNTAQHIFASPGTYPVMLTVDPLDGCATSVIKLVTAGPALSTAVAPLGPTVFCEGDSTELRAPQGSNWLWNTGQSTRRIWVKESGAYSVVYTNTQGNPSSSALVNITVYPGLDIDVEIFPASNGQNNGGAVITATGGGSFLYTYNWNTGATTASVGGLAPGNYTVTVSDGQCPKVVSVVVPNQVVPVAPGIVETEYFFDTDPGVGLGSALFLPQGSLVQSVLSIPTTGLVPGYHKLNLRSRDHLGQWGHAKPHLILVGDPAGAVVDTSRAPIAAMEYFFDEDPGLGMGTPIPGSYPSHQINANPSISFAGLSTGQHRLLIRTIDTDGNASVVQGRTVHVDFALPEPNTLFPIVRAEYFYGADPGVGQAQVLNVPVGNALNLIRTFDVSSFSPGAYKLSLRFQDLAGRWSAIRTVPFTVVPTGCLMPTVNFGTLGGAMAGLPTTLASFSSNVAPGAVVRWDIHADGSFEYMGNQVQHTFAVGGSYDVLLEIDNGGTCVSSKVGMVNVDPNPSGVVQLSGATVFCEGDTLIITAPAGTNHLWNTGETTQSIVVLNSGAYQASYTDVLGNPRVTGLVDVSVNPTLQVTSQIWPSTNGLNNGMIQLQTTGGKGFGYTYSWSDGPTGPVRSGLAPGVYTVTVTDGNCPETVTYTVGSNTVADGILAAEYFVDSDPGVGNGTPIPVSQGMMAAGSALLSTSGWASGIHEIGIRVLDFDGVWSHANSHRVWIEPAYSPQPSGLLAALEYFYDADPGPGAGQPIAIAPTALLNGSYNLPTTGLSSGAHKFALRAQDQFGQWSLIKTGNFDNCTPPPAPVAGANIAVCLGQGFQLQCTPGSADPVLWTGPNGFSSSDEDPLIAMASVAQTGYYRVQSVGPLNCLSAPDSVWVQVDVAPGIPGAINGTAALCGALVTQNYFVSPVPGATGYVWQLPSGAQILSGNGTNQIAVDFNGWLGTVDTLRVRATNSCDTTSSPALVISRYSSTVVVNVTAQGPTTFCAGDSVRLVGAPATGLIYQWSRNGLPLSGENASSLWVFQSGQYNLTATDPNGCQGQSNPILVTVNNCGGLVPPTVNTIAVLSVSETTASISGEVVSAGSSAVLSRGVVYDTLPNPDLTKGIASSGSGVGAFTANLTGLTGVTTYYARAYATNASGTAYGSEVSFTTDCPKPITLSIILTDAPFCAGDPATLRAGFTGGIGAKSILWSTGATTKFVVVPVGTYWVTVTDVLGCSASDTFTVTDPAGAAYATSLISVVKSGANFTVNWNAVSLPPGTNLIGYRVGWRVRNSGLPFVQSPLLGAATTSYVANLASLCNGNYEFVVWVRYRIGSGPATTSAPSCPLSRGHNNGSGPCKDQETSAGASGEFLAGEQVYLYPNPTADRVYLSADLGSTYTVTDLSGRILQTGACTALETPIDLGAYAKGVYIVQVEKEGRLWKEKVLRD